MDERTQSDGEMAEGRSMYTFRRQQPPVTAAVQREADGELFIRMKPHETCTEEQLYRLMAAMGFEEALPPLKK